MLSQCSLTAMSFEIEMKGKKPWTTVMVQGQQSKKYTRRRWTLMSVDIYFQEQKYNFHPIPEDMCIVI